MELIKKANSPNRCVNLFLVCSSDWNKYTKNEKISFEINFWNVIILATENCQISSQYTITTFWIIDGERSSSHLEPRSLAYQGVKFVACEQKDFVSLLSTVVVISVGLIVW